MNLKYLWSFISVCLVSYCSIGSPPIVMAASIIGIIFATTAAFGYKHCNILGAICSGLFGFLSYSAGFYGNAAINIIFLIPYSFYGWWLWVTRTKTNELKRSLTRRQIGIATISSSALFVLACIFSYFVGSKMPLYDAFTTVLPLVAAILLINAYREQWYLWIVYNGIETYMWYCAYMANQNIFPVFIMRLIFAINSFVGWYEWNKKSVQ